MTTNNLENFFNEQYLKYSERILDSFYNARLKSLLGLSNFKPSKDLVKEAYILSLKTYSCLRDEGKIDDAFQDLGIEIPSLLKNEIENIHYCFFKGDLFTCVSKMSSLHRITGVLPKLPEEEIQEFYKKELYDERYCHLDELIELKNLTKIIPKNLDETRLSITFLNMATKISQSYKSQAEDLESIVGMKCIPKEIFIQEKHLELLKEKDANGYYSDYNSKLLEEYFEVKPSTEVLSEVFTHFIDKKDYKHIGHLAKKFNYNFSKEMRDGYRNLVMEKNEFGYLIPFKKETSIQHDFNYEFVQEKYFELIEKHDFSDLEIFIDFTEISPSNGIIQEGYKLFSQKGQLEYIAYLKKISGIEPDASVYEVFNQGLLNNFEEQKKVRKFSLKSLFLKILSK